MADSRRTRPGSRQRVAGLRKRSTQNKTAKTGLSRPGREAGATEAVEKGPVEIYARDGKRIDPEAVQELAADAPVEVQEAEEHLQEREEP